MNILKRDSEQTTLMLGSESEVTDVADEQLPAALVCLIGPKGHVGRRWPLSDQNTYIGRLPSNEITVNDPSVSRVHASIIKSCGNTVLLTDQGSSNGTRLDNRTITPQLPVPVRDNQLIKIGNAVFKYLAPGNIESLSSKYLYETSQKDALTGAFRRDALDQLGPDAITKATTQQSALSIILLDVDHFKRINDTKGHIAGDAVLQKLAGLLRNELLRATDYLARYGGEEFVIILTETTSDQALDIAERIRQRIESHRFSFEHGQIPVTVSLGVAELQSPSEQWPQLFKRADRALYNSKQGGRNQVKVANHVTA